MQILQNGFTVESVWIFDEYENHQNDENYWVIETMQIIIEHALYRW